jgi:hypothetical protein
LRRILEACQGDGTGNRKDWDPREKPERSPEMTTLKLTVSYARHLLTSLAAVAFGIYMN